MFELPDRKKFSFKTNILLYLLEKIFFMVLLNVVITFITFYFRNIKFSILSKSVFLVQIQDNVKLIELLLKNR